ncbi:M28 family metallopeptidase [Aegicerativicinus sediminis]
MKLLLIASALSLVGSCATHSYKQRIESLKQGIAFENRTQVEQFSKSISPTDLRDHVCKLSSDEFEGRKVGESGHDKTVDYLEEFYRQEEIPSPLGTSYTQTIPREFFKEDIKESKNVIAYIKGSEKANETVIVSAHSDHLGKDGETIYYGADDNASGTAAVMEIAQAFQKAAKLGIKPKRNVAFLHLTAEEMGLNGSLYYVDNPVIPIEETVADLNIDMIGRVDEAHKDDRNYIYVIGADRLSTELHYINQEANNIFTKLNLDYTLNDVNDANRYYFRSDHYNFAQKGIPVIFYFDGEHEDYHLPTDTAEKIDYELLALRTRLIFATMWYLANSDNRIIADKIR